MAKFRVTRAFHIFFTTEVDTEMTEINEAEE